MGKQRSTGFTRGAQTQRSALTSTISTDFGPRTSGETLGAMLSPRQVKSQILELTRNAKQLAKEGQSEPAFESLMQAYLLDPLSPHVFATEKVVLPARENARSSEDALTHAVGRGERKGRSGQVASLSGRRGRSF